MVEMSDDISYEQHVQQNNSRLISIGAALADPLSFESACAELTSWCSDQRAFTQIFEENLMAALQVAVDNGVKEGFNFPFAVKLIETCFPHRKQLSKESATRINRWYDQYRRLKKNGGKRKRKAESAEKPTEQIIVTDCGTMWPQGGAMPGPSPMQSPAYGPTQMMPMPGYGMQPSPFPPMDPTGARPQYAGGDPAMYDQAMAMQHQQQRMAMMQQQQQQQMQQQMPAKVSKKTSRNRRQNSAGNIATNCVDPAAYPNVPMGANSVPGQSQPLLRVPSQPALLSPAYAGMMPNAHPGHPANYPMSSSAAYPPSAHQMIRAGPPMLFGQIQQPTQHQQVMSYPNPNIPGTPPVMHQEVPFVTMAKETLLKEFKLEHDHSISASKYSKYSFTLQHEIYQALAASPHMDVQFKSYNINNNRRTSEWPVSKESGSLDVRINVNGHPIPISNPAKALYIRNYVHEGENSIELLPSGCICNNYFVLQLVVKIPVSMFHRQVFGEMNMRGKNAETCKKRLMNMMQPTGIQFSLTDHNTGRLMGVPAHSTKCSHASCFDLEPMLMQQLENTMMQCPICSVVFSPAEFEIDLFLYNVIRECMHRGSTFTEVRLEPNGVHRLIDPNEASRKRLGDDATYPMKRIKSEQFSQSQLSQQYPSANSVPTVPFGQSPIFSPHANSFSPAKTASPMTGKGGPETPATPGVPVVNPNSVVKDEKQNTSPQAMTIQQHGSVEAPSLTGSAPYTPASLSNSLVAAQTETHTTMQNISNIDFEFGDIFKTQMTSDDMRRYLAEPSNMKNGDPWQTLQDFHELIAAGKI